MSQKNIVINKISLYFVISLYIVIKFSVIRAGGWDYFEELVISLKLHPLHMLGFKKPKIVLRKLYFIFFI